MELEKELPIYERERPNLTTDEGKIVSIGGERVVDVHTSKEFGLTTPFLVEGIESIQ
jgi:hypothetical protein